MNIPIDRENVLDDNDDVAQVLKSQTLKPSAAVHQSSSGQTALEGSTVGQQEQVDTRLSAIEDPHLGTRSVIAAAVIVALIAVPMIFEFNENSPQTAVRSEEKATRTMPVVTAQPVEIHHRPEKKTIDEPAVEPAAEPSPDGHLPLQATASSSEATFSSHGSQNANLIQINTMNSVNSDTGSPLSYRASADAWINEIKFLIADGQVEKAKDEHELLGSIFPEAAAGFQPDFSRRALETVTENPNLKP